MKRQQLKLAGLIFGLGLLGVLSTLTMELPLPEEIKKQLLEKVSEDAIPWLLMLNPIIMLLVFTVLGTALFKKVNLSTPILESIVSEKQSYNLPDIFKTGILGGILAGTLITILTLTLHSSLPQEFIEFGEKMKPSLLVRFLYGGITEEILMRFGMMTLIIWIASKITGNLNPTVYWIGILIAALLFAAGHLPLIQLIKIESPANSLYAYIILGNTIGGIIFGWLYWKKGLEAAFLGHIFAHVTMLAGEQLF